MSGYIDYEEFIRATIDNNLIVSEKNLLAAFNNFDKNKNGKLDREELKEVLQSEDNEYIEYLIKKIDTNNDGEIDFKEFSVLMNELLHDIMGENEAIKTLVIKRNNENEVKHNQVNKDQYFTTRNIFKVKIENYKNKKPVNNYLEKLNLRFSRRKIKDDLELVNIDRGYLTPSKFFNDSNLQ